MKRIALIALLLVGFLRAEVLNVEVKRLTDTQYDRWMVIQKEAKEVESMPRFRTQKNLEDWDIGEFSRVQQEMRAYAHRSERMLADRKAFLAEITGEKDVEEVIRHMGLLVGGTKEEGKRRVSVEIRGRFAVIETFTDENDAVDSSTMVFWR